MENPIKYYMDEHVPRAVVRGLRVRGVDVVTTPEAGLMSATDQQHLEFASSEGRALFTQDEDFLKLHAAGLEHAGIVYAPQGASIGDVIRGLMLVQQLLSADEMKQQVEFL